MHASENKCEMVMARGQDGAERVLPTLLILYMGTRSDSTDMAPGLVMGMAMRSVSALLTVILIMLSQQMAVDGSGKNTGSAVT
jgi:hypothetical protein